MANWRLLSTHGSVLLCVARRPHSRLRDIADCVGITERATHSIVSDLVEEGYVVKTRNGTRNSYALRTDAQVDEPMLEEQDLGRFVSALAPER